MPAVTANAIVRNTLKRMGRLGATETPSAEDAVYGLDTLNTYLDGLNTENDALFTEARTTHALSASTASYTIGSGGDFNRERPEVIRAGGLIDASISSTQEAPIEGPISQESYQGIGDKTLTSNRVSRFYYDHGYAAALGTIIVWPVPDHGSLTLVLYTPTLLTQFANLTTTYYLPSGYVRMLELNLALEMAGAYEWTPPEWHVRSAMKALANVKIRNTKPLMAALDPSVGHTHREYDIYTDSWR